MKFYNTDGKWSKCPQKGNSYRIKVRSEKFTEVGLKWVGEGGRIGAR